MELRKAIALVMRENYISQSDLARITGVPRQRINDFLRGRVDTRSDLIEKYIQALTPKQRIRLMELIGVEDDESE